MKNTDLNIGIVMIMYFAIYISLIVFIVMLFRDAKGFEIILPIGNMFMITFTALEIYVFTIQKWICGNRSNYIILKIHPVKFMKCTYSLDFICCDCYENIVVR